MGSCCGGNSDAVMSAKRIVLDLMAMQAPEGGPAMPPPDVTTRQDTGLMPPIVRMRFTGEQVGAITFFGKSGTHYRGGNNNLEKYADVLKDDVDKLALTGMWEIVPLPPREQEQMSQAEIVTPPWLGENAFKDQAPTLAEIQAAMMTAKEQAAIDARDPEPVSITKNLDATGKFGVDFTEEQKTAIKEAELEIEQDKPGDIVSVAVKARRGRKRKNGNTQ